MQILLIEDNPGDADSIGLLLHKVENFKFHLKWTEDLSAGLDYLARYRNSIDIILLGLSLPDSYTLETLTQVHNQASCIPIIVLTESLDEEWALSAVRGGAQDYWVKKQIDGDFLVRGLHYAIERKQTEVAMKQLNEELETQVEERTQALQEANAQLIQEITERERAEAAALQALEKEKELSELKSRFISMISHEYRTPLTTILLSVGILELHHDKLTETKRCVHLQRIQNQVKHLTDLVNDVLLINQVEEKGLDCSPTLLDLLAFCQELIEDIKLNTKAQHEILFEIQGICTKAYLDSKSLRQILINLLDNAVKYSPEGGTIQFKCIRNLDQVIFVVQDQGIGISLEDQPQLMKSFYRGTNVETISGTGLGLTIVQECVNLLGGNITLESQIGVGTTFKVTLPLQGNEHLS